MFARPCSPAFPYQMEMVVKVKSAGEGVGLGRLCSKFQPLGQRSICRRSRKFVFGYIPMYNFSPVYFLYFLQALFLSDFTYRTPNNDQQVEQLYYCLSSKSYNPETSMSSAVAALLHAIRTGVKIVPREKSGTKRFAWTDSHDSSIIL